MAVLTRIFGAAQLAAVADALKSAQYSSSSGKYLDSQSPDYEQKSLQRSLINVSGNDENNNAKLNDKQNQHQQLSYAQTIDQQSSNIHPYAQQFIQRKQFIQRQQFIQREGKPQQFGGGAFKPYTQKKNTVSTEIAEQQQQQQQQKTLPATLKALLQQELDERNKKQQQQQARQQAHKVQQGLDALKTQAKKNKEKKQQQQQPKLTKQEKETLTKRWKKQLNKVQRFRVALGDILVDPPI